MNSLDMMFMPFGMSQTRSSRWTPKASLRDPERTLNFCRSVSEKLSIRTKKHRSRDIRSAKVVIQAGASSAAFWMSMNLSAGIKATSFRITVKEPFEPWEADTSAGIP